MKKILKFNWGTRIFFLYSGFVVMIIFFVVRSVNQKIDLVAPDYYNQEIGYQDKLDCINRSNSLKESPVIRLKEGNITLNFPELFIGKEIKGNILFFRPSDKSKDKTFPISTDKSGIQIFSENEFSKGLYRVQIDWKVNGVGYFNENVIVIN